MKTLPNTLDTKTAQARADKCPTSSSFSFFLSPFQCCFRVLWFEKGAYPENSHVVFCHNSVLFKNWQGDVTVEQTFISD